MARCRRARDNAVLVCAAIGQTHHRLDFLIGPGKALDPERFFIVAIDAIGNGLTSSPSTSTAQPLDRFPRFTIRDMVASQHAVLTQVLGLSGLAAVAGASMGGMQALQWGVSYPRVHARDRGHDADGAHRHPGRSPSMKPVARR